MVASTIRKGRTPHLLRVGEVLRLHGDGLRHLLQLDGERRRAVARLARSRRRTRYRLVGRVGRELNPLPPERRRRAAGRVLPLLRTFLHNNLRLRVPCLSVRLRHRVPVPAKHAREIRIVQPGSGGGGSACLNAAISLNHLLQRERAVVVLVHPLKDHVDFRLLRAALRVASTRVAGALSAPEHSDACSAATHRRWGASRGEPARRRLPPPGSLPQTPSCQASHRSRAARRPLRPALQAHGRPQHRREAPAARRGPPRRTGSTSAAPAAPVPAASGSIVGCSRFFARGSRRKEMVGCAILFWADVSWAGQGRVWRAFEPSSVGARGASQCTCLQPRTTCPPSALSAVAGAQAR